MKYKNINLEWNVLYWDDNSNSVKKYNALNDEIKEIIYKEIKSKKINNYAELYARFNRWAHYHYWCKAECEMMIGGLFDKDLDEFEKVDIYKQIEINLDRIIEYIILKMEIIFDK